MVPAQILTSAAAFRLLAGDDKELSMEKVTRLFQDIFKDYLAPEDLQLMVHNCFLSMACEDPHGTSSPGSGAYARARAQHYLDRTDAQSIALDGFVRAALRTYPMDFAAFATAFDREDRLGPLEAVFAERVNHSEPGCVRKQAAKMKKERGGCASALPCCS